MKAELNATAKPLSSGRNPSRGAPAIKKPFPDVTRSRLHRGSRSPILCLLTLLVLWTAPLLFAQGTISSGEALPGTISPAGDIDTWTFSATAGEEIIVSLGRLTDTGGGFIPRIRVFSGPTLIAADTAAPTAARVIFTADQTGTYTILVDDGNINTPDGTGTYQLFLFVGAATFTVPVGDNGGALTNGGNHPGHITVADLDIWSFTANTGDSVVLGLGEFNENDFLPGIRLYAPDGTLVAADGGTVAARVTYTAAQTGTYLVVVLDANINTPDGTADYQLHLAKIPGSFIVPAGDEGGTLLNGSHRTGTITLGDSDLWTFTASVGSSFTVSLGRLSDTSGGFLPEIRLYRPDGSLLVRDAGVSSAKVVINSADQSGTYTVVVVDGNINTPDGTGTYQLSLAGVFASPPRADFNHDGLPDWVLTNPLTHQLAVWYLNDGTFLGGALLPTLPAGWTLIDADQFGGSGTSSDLLLFNSSTGATAVWYFNGASFVAGALGPKVPAGWTVLLSQDFNSDGKPDLLLYQASTHKTAVWFLNGTVFTGGAFSPTIPAGWAVAGAADFNSDSKPDLLLWTPSGRSTAIWYLNGTSFLAGAGGPTLPAGGWRPAIIDDVNRDGKPDFVLWNPSTHQTAIWHLNNSTIINGVFGPSTPANWWLFAPK
jgi:VCBS repeat protein